MLGAQCHYRLFQVLVGGISAGFALRIDERALTWIRRSLRSVFSAIERLMVPSGYSSGSYNGPGGGRLCGRVSMDRVKRMFNVSSISDLNGRAANSAVE